MVDEMKVNSIVAARLSEIFKEIDQAGNKDGKIDYEEIKNNPTYASIFAGILSEGAEPIGSAQFIQKVSANKNMKESIFNLCPELKGQGDETKGTEAGVGLDTLSKNNGQTSSVMGSSATADVQKKQKKYRI